MKKFLFSVLFLLTAAPLFAQTTGVPGQKFAWDQTGPDLATVQAFTFKHYDDAAVTGTAFSGVNCTGTVAPYQCEVLIPAYVPGPHKATVTAANLAGESPQSAPLTFTFVVTPGAPTNFRIKDGGVEPDLISIQ